MGLIAEPRDMEPIEVGLPPELVDMEPEFVGEFAPDMAPDVDMELDVDMEQDVDMEPIVVGLPPLPDDMGAPEGGDEG